MNSSEPRVGQLTCFELFLILFPIACGIVVGRYVGAAYGWLYGLSGGVLVCGLGAGIGVGLFRIFVALFGWWCVPFPACQVCKSDDYEWLETMEQGTFYACRRCGTKYRLDKEGKRFMKILPDDSVRPYVRRRRFRGWMQDEMPANGLSDQV